MKQGSVKEQTEQEERKKENRLRQKDHGTKKTGHGEELSDDAKETEEGEGAKADSAEKKLAALFDVIDVVDEEMEGGGEGR